MSESQKFLSAIIFARPEVGTAIIGSLYMGSDQPIQASMTVPFFTAAKVQTMIDQFNPQVVIVDSGVVDYNVRSFTDIRQYSKNPVLLVGLAPVGSSEREEMLGVGLDAVYSLPYSSQIESQMCSELPRQYETVKSEWKKGAWSNASPEMIRKATAESGGASWERGCITVWSPKGGVGKTTVSTELAVALSGIGGRKVALIDANMNGGHIRLRLSIAAEQSIVTAAMAYSMDKSTESSKREMNERISNCLVKVPGNPHLSVMTGVTNMDQANSVGLREEYGEEFMTYLVDYLKRVYDFVIIDCGSSLNAGVHVGALLKADRVLVVCTPDMSSMTDAKVAIHNTINKQYGIDMSRLGLVVNSWQDDLGVTLPEAAGYIQIPALGVVPANTEGMVTKCANQGKSFVAEYMSRDNNSPSVESTMDGFVTVASHYYPPVANAWAERNKNRAKSSDKKGGLFGLGRKK